MSLCTLCLLLLLNHICAYIWFYIMNRSAHIQHRPLPAFLLLVSLLPWLMYVQTICKNVKTALRECCKANACFPLSQIWSPAPWKPLPGPVLFCPSLHVYTLYSESAFFQSGSSDFPHFTESNLLHAKYLEDTSKSLERNFHKLCWTYY